MPHTLRPPSSGSADAPAPEPAVGPPGAAWTWPTGNAPAAKSAAIVQDLCTRRIVGRQVADRLRTGLALDALQMASWIRRHESTDLAGLEHHSDEGPQHVPSGHSESPTLDGAVTSVDCTGDPHHDEKAGAFTWCSRPSASARRTSQAGPVPWQLLEHGERAVADYLDWFHTRRQHGGLGSIPPVEFQAQIEMTAQTEITAA